MLELLQLTNDAAYAREVDAIDGMRIFIDLELHGKIERQAGRDTHITTHRMSDIDAVRCAVTRSQVMVRLNPLHKGSQAEIDESIARGAQRLMLPFFRSHAEVTEFCERVAGRVPVTALLETASALNGVKRWVTTPGLDEVFVGLNDLHLDLKLPFMYLPLAYGWVDEVARIAQAAGRRFGFGGIARMGEGLLSGAQVLAEHVRMGSRAVILSRTFHGARDGATLAQAVAELRAEEARSAKREGSRMAMDQQATAECIWAIGAQLDAKNPGLHKLPALGHERADWRTENGS
jgi:2-keto-3-deoxy-L-rhamnonate aldolase RhmA